MAIPLDPKEIVTVQELAISNMLEIEALRQLLFEKGIVTKDEFIAKFKKLDREMKEKGGGEERRGRIKRVVEGLMAKVHKKRVLNISILIFLSIFLFFPINAQGNAPPKEGGYLPEIWEILKLVIAGFIGGLGNAFWTRRKNRKQSQALIVAFLTEQVYNFSRCVLYYGQNRYRHVSKSSLYEFTDAAALSSLANVVGNPAVMSSIMELKSQYYQVNRHMEHIAPKLENVIQIKSEKDVLDIHLQLEEISEDQYKQQSKKLLSQENALLNSCHSAQRTAVEFFNYEEAVNDISVILSEAKKLIHKNKVVEEMENKFDNNCAAKKYIDEEIKKATRLIGDKQREKWCQRIEKEFGVIINRR